MFLTQTEYLQIEMVYLNHQPTYAQFSQMLNLFILICTLSICVERMSRKNFLTAYHLDATPFDPIFPGLYLFQAVHLLIDLKFWSRMF